MPKNKVKRGQKIKILMWVRDFNTPAHQEAVEKYSWICTVCGREYAARHEAQSCRHMGTPKSFNYT